MNACMHVMHVMHLMHDMHDMHAMYDKHDMHHSLFKTKDDYLFYQKSRWQLSISRPREADHLLIVDCNSIGGCRPDPKEYLP